MNGPSADIPFSFTCQKGMPNIHGGREPDIALPPLKSIITIAPFSTPVKSSNSLSGLNYLANMPGKERYTTFIYIAVP